MSERGIQPAYPTNTGSLDNRGALDPYYGLTIRERFAMAAMQAILTGAVARGCPRHEWTEQDMSVRVADALIAELSKPAQPDPLLVEAREIVTNFLGMVKQVPELNHHKYVSFGVRVNKFLDASKTPSNEVAK